MKVEYLVADVTRQDKDMPHVFYSGVSFQIGRGPAVPVRSFTHEGKDFMVLRVFGADHPHNPFGIPVVAAIR